MIAITSIAPGHKNYDSQLKAIQSWKAVGYDVVSLNSEEEIEKLKDFTGVKFIKTSRHNKQIFGKPYVIVSALIDYLKEVKSEHSLIINSDIIIKDETGYTEKLKSMSENGIIVMNRRDFENDINNSILFEDGFDAFFINRKFLDVFPQTILCLGQCHWDYWLPYVSVINNVKIFRNREPYIFHVKHQVQYSKNNWYKTGEIFQGEVGLTKFRRVEELSGYTYKQIKTHLR